MRVFFVRSVLSVLSNLSATRFDVGSTFNGRGSRSSPIPVWLVAGIEGTGHHFFDYVGHRLRYATERRKKFTASGNEAYNDLQLCWFALSAARPHAFCHRTVAGCATAADLDGESCPLAGARAAAKGSARPWTSALYLPSCSYPCGSPGTGEHELSHTSPDLPRFAAEAVGAGYRPQVVVTLREPVATVASAHFRRHGAETSLKSTAFHLWLNLGLLDAHLAVVETTVPVIYVHYEELVAGRNATARIELARFLDGVSEAALDAALRHARSRKHGSGPKGEMTEMEARYVEGLFFKPSSTPRGSPSDVSAPRDPPREFPWGPRHPAGSSSRSRARPSSVRSAPRKFPRRAPAAVPRSALETVRLGRRRRAQVVQGALPAALAPAPALPRAPAQTLPHGRGPDVRF